MDNQQSNQAEQEAQAVAAQDNSPKLNQEMETAKAAAAQEADRKADEEKVVLPAMRLSVETAMLEGTSEEILKQFQENLKEVDENNPGILQPSEIAAASNDPAMDNIKLTSALMKLNGELFRLKAAYNNLVHSKFPDENFHAS